jgi:uncharacterized protein (TIGR03118 family)
MQERGLTWYCAGLAAVGLSCSLYGCGGGGGGSGGGSGGSAYNSGGAAPAPPASGMNYAVTNLVSDGGVPAAHTDSGLQNPWGLAFNPQGDVWLGDNGTSLSTLYDGNGVAQSLIVTIPAGQAGAADPTGLVFNATQDFTVKQGSLSGISDFIFVGEAGTVSGWSPAVSATSAITMFDGASSGTVYKGAAIANYLGVNYLYATDFHNKKVDVFDTNFNKASVPGGFKDPSLPAGYAPYGIQAIGNQLYVTFAMQDAQAQGQVAGSGMGILDQFDSGGNLVKQLVASGGPLNAPWGIAIAPANFGTFSNDLLVGNFGDGKINAFDPTSGKFLGSLTTSSGTNILIDGLWGLAFGNGVDSQPSNTLFFTAGPGNEAHGLYGRIDLK